MKNRLLNSRLNILTLLVIASLILSACGPGSGVATGADGTIIWLDQPMTNYMLPMAPFTLIAHAGLPHGGISQVDFQVNGVSVGVVPTDTSSEFLRTEIAWNPSAPGEYHIRAVATSPGGETSSRLAYVCVLDGITASQPWVGNCVRPTSGLFNLSVNLRSDPIYRGTCAGSALDLEAVLSGDTSSIASLQAGWYFTNIDGSASSSVVSGESGHAMTRQSDSTYTFMRDFTNAASDFGLDTGTYLLYASAQAMDASGHVLASQNIGPVNWLDCSTTPGKDNIPSVTPFVPTLTPVPADTTPPSISGVSLDPADTVYYSSGCGPNSLSVQANISDPTGIASATIIYHYSAGSNISIGMSSGGGNTYLATINVGSEAYSILSGVDGTLTVTVQANDQQGNNTSVNAGSVAVRFCPG